MFCTPPGFNASEVMAEIDAGVSIIDSERRVAVTRTSLKVVSLAAGAAGAAVWAQLFGAAAHKHAIPTKRAIESLVDRLSMDIGYSPKNSY